MIVLTLDSDPTSLEYHLWDMNGGRDLVSGFLQGFQGESTHEYEYLYGGGRGRTTADSPGDALGRALDSIALAEPSIKRIEGLSMDVGIVAHVFPVRPPGVGSTGILDDGLVSRIERFAADLPGQGAAIRACLDVAGAARRRLPESRHAAVFEDAFFQTRTAEGACYPIRPTWGGKDLVRRLGRGGLRISSVVVKALDMLGSTEEAPRIVVCDLDDVPQVTSVRGQTVYDSTCEFDGSSRILSERGTGAVPPGLRDALLRTGAPDGMAVDTLFSRHGGLACIEPAPLTLDDLESLAAEGTYGPASRMLFDQVVREVGGQMTLLGGLDVLVFTGRTGLGSPMLRSLVTTRLRLFRIAIDEKRNEVANGNADLTGEGSRVKVLVVAPSPSHQAALETVKALGDVD